MGHGAVGQLLVQSAAASSSGKPRASARAIERTASIDSGSQAVALGAGLGGQEGTGGALQLLCAGFHAGPIVAMDLAATAHYISQIFLSPSPAALFSRIAGEVLNPKF